MASLPKSMWRNFQRPRFPPFFRSKDLGEVGQALSQLVVELRGFGTDEEEKKGILGLFKKAGNRLEAMKAQYAKVEANVDQIARQLEQHQLTLMKDVAMLDQMYELNLKYYKELTMYILAGKRRLEQLRTGELPDLKARAESTGAQEDAQRYNDLSQMCERFEKKLHDLELTRVISIQMGPQTRLLQNNDTLMVEKIQSSLVNTIPLWKSQMVLALGLEHSRQATAAQSAVAEMTNELLKKNADLLKMGTVETAREAERSVVDLETLQHTNQQLIATLDEVMDIQRQGAEKRRNAEAELGRIEGELSRSSWSCGTDMTLYKQPLLSKRAGVVCVFRHNSEIGEAGIPRHRLAGRTLQAEHLGFCVGHYLFRSHWLL